MPGSHAARAMLLLVLATGCGGPPAREGVVELTIGPGTPGAPDRFGIVSGLAVDEAGRIWVSDGARGNVRAFSSDGTFLFALNGDSTPGGSLLGPCCLSFDPGGRLWIDDGGHDRYLAFQPDSAGARFLFAISMPPGEPELRRPITFDSQGRLIRIRRETGSGEGATRLVLDSAGTVVDSMSIAAVPRDSLGYVRLPGPDTTRVARPPYPPRALFAFGPGGDYARAVSSRYHVVWFAPDGSVRTEIDRDDRGPTLDTYERALAEEQLNADARDLGVAPIGLVKLLPRRKQVLTGLYFDHAGRLWVERSVRRDEPRSADVYNSDGEALFRLSWPSGIDLSDAGWIGEDFAIAVHRDTIPGNARVVRLRFPSP